MTLFVEKPAIASIRFEIVPSERHGFIDWQASFNREITRAAGFVSLEFSQAPDKKDRWTVAERFITSSALAAWQSSQEYQSLIGKLKALSADKDVTVIQGEEGAGKGCTTEVFVTEVSSGREEEFIAWSAKIHQAEAKFPGFRGVYIQSPSKEGKHWITLLQFDCMENLDRWLKSRERKEVLEESCRIVSSLESHRVVSPYSGWFANIAKTGSLPPVWKQTMLVLLVLFPIVMLEERFLSPVLAGINPALATFFGNLISVTLISFPLMPIAISLLGFWLPAENLKTNILGSAIVLLLYLIEIALFWNFF